MKSKAIFIGSEENIAKAYGEKIRTLLCRQLEFSDKPYTRDELKNESCKKELRETEYIFSTWGMAELSEQEISGIFPALKAVFYAAGTVQSFARPFLNRGVRIFSAWGANAIPVAEFTVAQIVLANKGYFHALTNNTSVSHCGNYNTSVGIIGAGMIGTLVIKMLKDYQLNVKVFDPFLSEEKAKELGVEKVGALTELFEKCHVISNHLANNPQTVGMIDRRCFDKMEDSGVFINTGRGQQIVEADMIEALKAEPSRIALLDVTYPEPPSKDSELYTLPNVFLSPHIAGSIGNEVQRMGEFMYDEFIRLTDGKPLKYEVTTEMLKTMA